MIGGSEAAALAGALASTETDKNLLEGAAKAAGIGAAAMGAKWSQRQNKRVQNI